MTSQEYILSVLKLPFSDEDKAAMIVKLVNAGIASGIADVSGAKVAPAQTLQPPTPDPTVKPPEPIPLPQPVIRPASGVTYHGEGGLRVDDIVPKDTPGTVYLPLTGHVVSLPSDGAGKPGNELFWGYLNRVKLQLGPGAADLIARAGFTLVQGLGPTATEANLHNGVADWPEIADRLCNWDAYHTQAQRDAAAAARQQLISGMQSQPGQVAPTVQPSPVTEPDTVPVQFN